MKKTRIVALMLTLCLMLALSAASPAPATVPNLSVTYIGISPWGGSYISFVAALPAMTRPEVIAALGQPDRSYGYSDVWIGHDQIYIGYYTLTGHPVAVVILPVTSW